MSAATNLTAIRQKVRRVTGRPSTAQLTDSDIDEYINTFYRYDFPEHLRLESLRVNYEFTTTASIAVYDFPINTYLTNMPPVFIAGYQSYMTQSRQNFFRVNPQLNFLQQSVYTGDGVSTAFTGAMLTNVPIATGFKPNPPGAFSDSTVTDIAAEFLKWNVLVSAEGSPDATSGISTSYSLVDDGQGNLFAPTDTSTNPASARGTINYVTGALEITNFVDSSGAAVTIPSGNPINVQYIPYQPSRPLSVMFFEDQFILWPIPDQAYTVSFEVYKNPTELLESTDNPQLKEWWQALAYGASLKIFADNADMDSLMKFQPLFDQQMRLIQRRTIVQYTPERVSTIYTEQQNGAGQFPFGNLFGGF